MDYSQLRAWFNPKQTIEQNIRNRYFKLWEYEEHKRKRKLSPERLQLEQEFKDSAKPEELAEIDRIQFEQWMYFQRASKSVLIANGRCPHCRTKAIPLMYNCLSCGGLLESEE